MVERFLDINARKHGGNQQSIKANERVLPHKGSWRDRILGLMSHRDAESKGTTLRDAADYFRKEVSQISGRFTELRVEGKIESTRRSENGYTIYRLANSSKVSVNSAVRRTLLVTGVKLAGEIIFEKQESGWVIIKITPSLQKIIGDTPVDQIGKRLDALHLGYKWV